jgi:hypothetical protein
MVDAEQLERFLNFREEAPFEFDSLRRDSVVDLPALGVEDEANESAGNDEKQAEIRDVRIRSFDIPGLHGIPDCRGYSNHDKKRHKLADGIDQCRMPDEQIALGLHLFGGSELGQVRVAESALDCDGLDGLSAKRAGFAVWVHVRSFHERVPIQARIPMRGEARG